MNLCEGLALKHTNVSRPQLSHSNSKQSVAASEDYFSFDENSSNGGNDRDHAPFLQRYSTPPSRFSTPDDDQNAQSPVTPAPRPGVSWDEKQLSRKPVWSSKPSSPTSDQQPSTEAEQKSLKAEKKDSKMYPYSPSTTPGIDEMPYIRFAIEQLTRDEEVRGSRHYVVGGDDDDYDDNIEDRILPEQILKPVTQDGNMAQLKEMQAGPQPTHPLYQRRSSSVRPYDVFVPYEPTLPSHRHPRLDFLPGILRPSWLGFFIFICLLMLTGLLFSAIWSSTHNGLWEYINFGDSRYFVFEYLPTILGMVILIWLFQVEVAVQRISPFMAMASHSLTARSQGAFLDLYPTHFLFPKTQHFRSGQPIIGTCFVIFWLFLFSIPLLASAFNVRYYPSMGTGTWRWVAVQGVIWTVIALYILLIVALMVLGGYLWRSWTGLKWDPRSLADIIALLERANIMNDYADSETFSNIAQFRQKLWNRTDRLGYWHTSRRPQDIFYGLGEEGGATRRYSVEQGRIREKPQVASNQSSITSLHELEPGTPHVAGDFSILADIRNAEVRRRYTPWFLSSSSILLWILIAIALLIAFLVVAFVNQASTRGFLPQLSANTNKAGFSSANFFYSFIPCLLGFLLYLLWLPLDFAHRRLAPFTAMSVPHGATAGKSLLLDYTYSLPLSVSIKAAANDHWKVALLSSLSLINAAIPVLAGGVFWPQWYPGTLEVRIAAQPAGLYALCFFLALYTLSFFLLLPGRKTNSLPHNARCLAEIISWLYMSPVICDRQFARCTTRADLVARLMGAPTEEDNDTRKGFWASVTSLVNRSRTALARPSDDVEAGPSGVVAAGKEKRLTPVPESAAAPSRELHENVRTRLASVGEKVVRYGFGVYMGRDGREHLGIDRVTRGGRDMVLF